MLMLISFLNELFFPTLAMALTAGPNSPEASSFEPVATTDMVSLLTGDFTYNLPVLSVPGPDGGGYSLSLSYHSGVTSEEEASWVGFGWTLNPGAINRMTRGIPDDYKGEDIVQYSKSRPNWTVGVKQDINLEKNSKDDEKLEKGEGEGKGDGGSSFAGFGKDGPGETDKDTAFAGASLPPLNLGFSRAVRFNNYQGINKSFGFSVGYKGMGSLGLNTSAGETTFSVDVNPAAIIRDIKAKTYKKLTETMGPLEAKDQKKVDEYSDKLAKREKASKLSKAARKIGRRAEVQAVSQYTSTYGLHSYTNFESSVAVSSYKGISYNYSASVQVNPSQLHIGFQSGHSGNFNIQVNQAKAEMKGFGYMYNPRLDMYDDTDLLDVDDNSEILSDHYVEKASHYDKKDYYLGIPFNNADNFSVSGEGLGGGFRLYHEKIGHYYPNFTTSKQQIRQTAIEVAYGVNLGLGFDFGLGFNKLETRDWKFPSNINPGDELPTLDKHQFIDPDDANRGFFRFNNDLGGNLVRFSSAAPSVASIPPKVTLPGTKKHYPNIASLGVIDNFSAQNSGRSSFIDYNLLNDGGNPTNSRIEKDVDIVSLSDRINPANALFEVATYNEAGMRYVYGLPVYTRNEKSYSIGLETPSLVNNYLAYEAVDIDIPLNNNSIVGEEKSAAYAPTYLLTQINTPDYVDIGPDGPDGNDFGGWTKFAYRDNATSNNGSSVKGSWYGYRTPYNGLLYQKNQISDVRDDMGSVSCGEKQIYYLKAVETKTHVAFFITNATDASVEFANYIPNDVLNKNAIVQSLSGSTDPRADGIGADITNSSANNPQAKDNSKLLEKLERIVLYSKDRFEKPLQTIHFEYDKDFSLVRNLPNTISSDYGNKGKLTLKRVWFEYEGVVNSKIAPYEFRYQYRKNYPSEVLAKYPDLVNGISSLTDIAENPDYQPQALDMWGNYQYKGNTRHDLMRPWVSQEANDPNFDPAAWQLKQIRLPSGGEINIQYEQKDYCYVQDRDAMAMVSLKSNSIDSDDPENTKFYLNLDDIGITAPADITALETKLKEFFGVDKPDYIDSQDEESHEFLKRRIYFKFLYALKGENPDLNHCKSEYITGYTTVNEVKKDGNDLYLSLGSPQNFFQQVFGNNDNKKNIPKHVCYDYVRTRKVGFLENDQCTNSMSKYDNIIQTFVDAGVENHIIKNQKIVGPNLKFKRDVVKKAILDMPDKMNTPKPKKSEMCKAINEQLSYLRIPLTKAKKGGGVRVKRLLMFDAGIESGDAMVYGSEYLYHTIGGRSSGVATNEPGAGREENALVNLLPKQKKNWLGRALSGRDKEQNEGPLGESLLPAPSVGHSRVIVRNIHTGKTGTGFQINEFFTVRDFPFDKKYSGNGVTGNGVEHTDLKDNKRRDWINIPAGLFNYKVDKRWYAQGYRFIINNMHGQQKKIASYGGTYSPFTFLNPNNKTYYLSTSTEYQYYQPGEKVPVIRYDKAAKEFFFGVNTLGEEQDYTMAMQTVFDRTLDFSLEIDVSIGLSLTPPIFVSFFPSFSYEEKELNTHTTSKVLHYPAIVKSIQNYQDGVVHKTEHLAFNPDNGEVVVIKTTDGYDGLRLKKSATTVHDGGIYSWTIPGSWVYDEMGQKAVVGNPDDRTNQLNITCGSIVGYGNAGNWLKNNFILSNGIFRWNTFNTPPLGVLSASADEYENNWFTDISSTSPIASIVSEYGIVDQSGSLVITASELAELNKKWHLAANHVYKTKRTSSDSDPPNPNNRIYKGGVYIDPLPMFDWTLSIQPPATNGKWIKTNEVLKYSPNGNALEEVNVIDIHSTAKFGYSHTLPILIAQNATYESVHFDDFETSSDVSVVGVESHSGKQSFDYQTNTDFKFIDPAIQGIKLTQQLIDKGAIVQAWVKHQYPDNPTQENTAADFKIKINNTLLTPFEKIASTGEWSLYNVKIDDWGSLSQGDLLEVKLNYNVDAQGGEVVFIDDFRFQPFDAEAVCYVYDVPSLRLVTQFDDQHFGIFYQYDNEGKLVRRMIETERGMKTLQENQYNTPVINRLQ